METLTSLYVSLHLAAPDFTFSQTFLCSRTAARLTRQVAEAQLPQAVEAVSPVVEEDGQSVAALVQLCASDDPQVLQRQVLELIQRHQHVARHFSYGLCGKGKDRWRN